ncbi:MAG: M42 family metallopeptidase [Oscillospiraceae bacterium]|nr:M42 family metallopeptidase [Oscillospiraceae bacterium]
MPDIINNLKTLCGIPGISGRETQVRETIISMIHGHCDYKTDNMGNLICRKKGTLGARKHNLMVSAHMDEVGLIVLAITDDGYLRFDTVGGIDPRVLPGVAVNVDSIIGDSITGDKITGVIGTKALHHLDSSEKDTAVKIEELYIDIGAKNKTQAEKYVKPGASITFLPNFTEFGDGMIRSKALDDRVGCAVMIELIKSEIKYDTGFAFTVQEEVGTRGSAAAAFELQPDVSLVLEATTANDIAGVEPVKQVCKVNGGTVAVFMDKLNIYDYDLYNKVRDLADKHNIPCQTKTLIAGGNDSGTIAKTAGGARTLALSVPCRYIHTPSNAVLISEIENMAALARLVLDIVCPERNKN